MTTLASFRDTLRELGNFPADDTRITDAVITREVNRALKRIVMVHDWPWLMAERQVVTTAAIRDYNLPDDFLRLTSLRDTDRGYNLSLRGIREVDEYEGRPGGRPSVYAINGTKLVLAYTPADAYNLKMRYVRRENVLSADSDAPLLPDYWEDGLYDAALVQLYRIVKQNDEAGLAEARFQAWVSETQDNIPQTRESIRIHVRPGGFL